MYTIGCHNGRFAVQQALLPEQSLEDMLLGLFIQR
jgi:hypothetical protein